MLIGARFNGCCWWCKDGDEQGARTVSKVSGFCSSHVVLA